jgi:hypothetical protein
MAVPAAVVVKLPRVGRTSALSYEASTDLLLYFPMPDQVRIFEYTMCDPRRSNQGCDIRYYGTYDSSSRPIEQEPRRATCTRYNYSVELMPFLTLHGAKCPDKTTTSIRIECGFASGTELELLLTYDNDARDKESVELLWHPGYNYPAKHIATWYADRSQDNSVLTWGTIDQDIPEEATRLDSFFRIIPNANKKTFGGVSWSKRLPFIRGYMTEDEDYGN